MFEPRLVTIVMPSFNQACFIEEAIRSIFVQPCKDIELIVIDGGSTDDTIEFLKKLSEEFRGKLRWISEKDRGPADAINKALRLSRGDIIGWLNSDDVYVGDSILRALNFFENNPDYVMVYGEGNHVDRDGKILGRYPTKPPSVGIEEFHNGCFICQPTVFLKRDVFDYIGYLDENLVTSFDFDLWLRIFKKFSGRIGFINEVLANSRIHEATITYNLRKLVALEGLSVISKHIGTPQPHWILTYINEACAAYPVSLEVKSLKFHINQTIKLAKKYLSPEDYSELKSKIVKDKRFKLSASGLFTNVFPNGWAPPSFEIRINRNLKKFSKIRIDCFNAVSNRVKIRTSWGDEQILDVNAPEFSIILRRPKEGLPSVDYIWIESDEAILSKLGRKYAFKVKKIRTNGLFW